MRMQKIGETTAETFYRRALRNGASTYIAGEYLEYVNQAERVGLTSVASAAPFLAALDYESIENVIVLVHGSVYGSRVLAGMSR